MIGASELWKRLSTWAFHSNDERAKLIAERDLQIATSAIDWYIEYREEHRYDVDMAKKYALEVVSEETA